MFLYGSEVLFRASTMLMMTMNLQKGIWYANFPQMNLTFGEGRLVGQGFHGPHPENHQVKQPRNLHKQGVGPPEETKWEHPLISSKYHFFSLLHLFVFLFYFWEDFFNLSNSLVKFFISIVRYFISKTCSYSLIILLKIVSLSCFKGTIFSHLP